MNDLVESQDIYLSERGIEIKQILAEAHIALQIPIKNTISVVASTYDRKLPKGLKSKEIQEAVDKWILTHEKMPKVPNINSTAYELRRAKLNKMQNNSKNLTNEENSEGSEMDSYIHLRQKGGLTGVPVSRDEKNELVATLRGIINIGLVGVDRYRAYLDHVMKSGKSERLIDCYHPEMIDMWPSCKEQVKAEKQLIQSTNEG